MLLTSNFFVRLRSQSQSAFLQLENLDSIYYYTSINLTVHKLLSCKQKLMIEKITKKTHLIAIIEELFCNKQKLKYT